MAVEDRLFDAGPAVESPVEPKAPVDKTFRPYDPNQVFLLPPSLNDWLPEGHLARFVAELVDEVLDLAPFLAAYTEVRGAPPYDPRLMLKLVIYGYVSGVRSSRAIERRCHDDVAFRFLAANTAPDFRSLSRFRRRHLEALKGLFTQALGLCQKAGMVRLGRVALDGTKVRANASRRKAMSYGRMTEREAELQGEIEAMMAEAEAADVAEDERLGPDGRDDDLPAELARREKRLAKIRAAKADLEAEAAKRAAAKTAAKAARAAARAVPTDDTATDDTATDDTATDDTANAAPTDDTANAAPTDDAANAAPTADTTDADTTDADTTDDTEEPEADAGEVPAPAPVDPKAQRNFTDPESRIMKTSDGSFHQCYNAQAVVDDAHQVIVATELGDSPADCPTLPDMLDAVVANCGAAPRQVLADAGYFSEDNVAAAAGRGVDALIATGRIKHNEKPPPAPRGRIPASATPKERMARKLRTKPGKAAYARRKAIVEPVFGQIDTCHGGKRVLLRGKQAASAEWDLMCACHNLRKLFGHRGTAKFAIA